MGVAVSFQESVLSYHVRDGDGALLTVLMTGAFTT